MMIVRFKSFGPIRRLLEEPMMEVEVPFGSTVLQVVQKVAEIGGAKLKDLILRNGGIDGNLIVMLNKKDVSTLGGIEISVSEGDEIALLPHVQGG
ncbi:MAG: MoaD/ThiS family protein [Candidatus Thorarchaeota archaeon]|nr:MoaD/ThiS family protein [Candidatus Thorarchaeota archaeon]MCK5390131.1 MoaD/ThiS family protein [Candidatus Thorarchaeota archaeon]